MKKLVKFFAAAVALMTSATTLAGGYQLSEYSVTGLGRAFAGVGIMGDDYSAIAFNPAGMSLMKSGIQAGAALVRLKTDVEDLTPGHSNAPGKLRVNSPLPHIFGQYKINDRWDVGMGIYAPYGLSTKYSRNWFGSAAGVKSQLVMIDFSPAVSYKATDKLTVGATFIARYIKGKLTNRIDGNAMVGAPIGIPVPGTWSKISADGWTVAGVLGAMYEPTKDTRFGFSWRTKSTQQVKGDHLVERPGARTVGIARANPDLPETFTLSAYHKIGKFGLSGTAKWTHWSTSFPIFPIHSSVTGDSTVEYKWRNTWTLSAGTDFYYNDNWTFRFGAAYDQSPGHTSHGRTIRIPDGDRYWVSCGASYTKNAWTVDVGYSHLFMKDQKIDDHGLNTEYDKSSSDIVGIQVQYRF